MSVNYEQAKQDLEFLKSECEEPGISKEERERRERVFKLVERAQKRFVLPH